MFKYHVSRFWKFAGGVSQSADSMKTGAGIRVVLNFIFFDKNIAKLGICVGR